MNRILLFLTFLLIVSTTQSIAQSEPGLGKAGTFAALGPSYLSNSGTTGITGDVGLPPQGVFTDDGELLIKGNNYIGFPFSTDAIKDVQTFYNYWASKTGVAFTGESLKANGSKPGVYRASGDVALDGIVVLDGDGDVNAKFVFIIDGDLTTPSPLPPTPGTGLLLQNGAQPKNIFWIVKGKIKLGSSTSFQGTMVSKGSITLEQGVNLIGRALTIESGITLKSNNIFLPNVIIADLNVKKVANQKDYLVGDEVSYTITVKNIGPSTASNVIVTEMIPPGLEFVRIESASAGAYNELTNEWVIDELKLNETAQLVITFKVLSPGEIKNKVKVGSNNPDPNPGDNTEEEPIVVPVVTSDLGISKTASGGPYVVGGTVTYTIVAKNSGPYKSENVIVNEMLPPSLELVSFTVSKGTFNPATGRYNVGTLASGDSATLQLVARIKGAGQIVNTASVSGSTTDPNPSNNSDTETIEVICDVPNLTLEGNDTQCAGLQNVTYRVSEVFGATYNFELTGGLTEVSRNGNAITVNVGNASGKIKVSVTDLCGNTSSITKDVTVTNTPVKPSIKGSTNVCANTNGLTFDANTTDEGVTYTWSATGDIQIVGENNGKAVVVNIGVNGGTLSVKTSNSCFESQAAVTTIKPTLIPVAPGSIKGAQEICFGSETSYYISEIPGATNYTWIVPTGWEIVNGQGSEKITVKAGQNSGNITVAASNNCGTSDTTMLAVKVNKVPAAPIAIKSSNGTCIGSTITYTIDAVASATGYVWTVPSDWTIKSGQGSRSIEVEIGTKAGDVTVAGTNGCGQGTAAKLNVAPSSLPAVPGNIEGPTAICANTSKLTYTIATPVNGITYNWTVPSGWTIVNGQGTSSIEVNAATNSGKVSVTATNSCATSEARLLDVVVTIPPAAPVTIIDMSTLCDGLVYKVDNVSGATSYTWTVPTGFTIVSGQGTTTISVKADSPNAFGNVTVTANNGTCSSAAASLPIDMSRIEGELKFPKAFSPNGDGKNDTWVVENLLKYPKNQVVIFNRWGSEVYKKANYQNDWNGNKLEPGTYFYKVSVTMCDGADKMFTGYVTIFR